MDEFTIQHLNTWLDRVVLNDERKQVKHAILGFVAEHPEVLEDRSWPEIRRLAERD